MKMSKLVGLVLLGSTALACGVEVDSGAEGEEVASATAALTELQRSEMIFEKHQDNLALLGAGINSTVQFSNGAKRDYSGASNNSSIYVGDAVGSAHIVMGFIRSKFLAKGAQNFFDFPTTDELPTFGNGGRYNNFRNTARILWKNGAGEAFEVHGSILGLWSSLGSEWSLFGYPISDEIPHVTGTVKSRFEFGNVYWNATHGAWPVLLGSNPNHQLVTHGWPRITSASFSSIQQTTACLRVSGSGFTPGKTISSWLASPLRPVSGARTAVVSGSGSFTLDQGTQATALCYPRSEIRTVDGFVTVRVVESDTGKTAVSRFITGAGSPYLGPI